MQSANTRGLLSEIPELMEYIFSTTPLEAGDVICAGAPEGVGLGSTPLRWLRAHKAITISIQPLGQLRNSTRAKENIQ